MSGNTGTGGPAPCLSIRQPWAWLIAHGWKNIENRTWPTGYRGRFLIHAAKGMTRAEYDACLLFVMSTGMTIWQALPMFDSPQLCRGGIVGEAELVDCVTHHGSEWFTGPYGFVLDNAKPLPFTPCRGALGFFRVTTPPERQSRGGGGSASGVGADTRERFFAHRT